MSKLSFIILCIIWFLGATFLYNKYVCNKNCNCKDQSTLIEDEDWRYTIKDQLRFGTNSAIPIVSNKFSDGMDTVAVHMVGSTPQRLITVEGAYTNAEENNTTYDNLGLARAAEVKEILVGKGIDRGSVFLSSKLNNDVVINNDTIQNGILFKITQLKDGEFTQLTNDNLFQGRNVYFETGKNSILLTAELNNYLENAKRYLAENPSANMSLTGYTDNVGDATSNLNLSQERAIFVKSKLEELGIGASQISVLGKGQENPIETNETDNGRAKNRRVQLLITNNNK